VGTEGLVCLFQFGRVAWEDQPWVDVGIGRRTAEEAGFIVRTPGCRQPGHDPVAGGGVATTARLFGLGTFWFDDATSESRRRIAVAAWLARVRSRCALGLKPSASTGSNSRASVLSVEWTGSGHGQVGRAGRSCHGGHGGHGGPGWPQRRSGHCEHGVQRRSRPCGSGHGCHGPGPYRLLRRSRSRTLGCVIRVRSLGLPRLASSA
jgi:hypothetical protein